MLSSENSDEFEYGPQHSTPVKGQETFLNKTQNQENNVHPTCRRFASINVEVNRKSHRIDDLKLLHHLDLQRADISTKPDCEDSFIDISKISMIENTSNHLSAKNTSMFDALQNDINLVSTGQPLDRSETNLTKQPQLHQNNQSLNHRALSTPNIFMQRALEQEFDKHDPTTGRYFHPGFSYRRAMPSDCISDSELSKQSLSPETIYQHVQSSEMSFGKVTVSPRKQRMVKAYHKVRASSVPRFLLTDANICNRKTFNLPSFSISDFNRAPAVFIEQDIINKQRQEIQLLMEELGSRDQELNDLVLSHQKQVKVWESNNEKCVALQARLSQYEDELCIREKQLKDSLSEMTRVNEQREVDALELKQTQNEMLKLAERIMENSLYIKEMEAQNQKLSFSLREFVSARQSFHAKEKELLEELEEKEAKLSDKQKEIDAMAEHIKFLESQCEELGEKNTTTSAESINWKKKYFQIKEEADRLSVECKAKEESVQKMTQQLHESLQQAIALQKALFTSCEREKCKEEVMYSLRKQHKRTMQELQNIRELYDRLTRDTTLYHLSVKDKEVSKDGKKKEEEFIDGKGRKGKGDGKTRQEEEEKRRQDSRRKHDSNTSSHKSKVSEIGDQTFLVKETKERKQIKDEKGGERIIGKFCEKIVCKSGEKNAGNNEKNKICKAKIEEPEVCNCECKNASQLICQKGSPRNTPRHLKSEMQPLSSAKINHTIMCRNTATTTSSTTLISDETNCRRRGEGSQVTLKKTQGSKYGPMKKSYCTESSFNQMHSLGLRNTSKNADFKESRSFSSSRVSTVMSVKSQMTSPFVKYKNMNCHDKSVIEEIKDGDKGGDSSSDVSHIASPSQYDDELTPADSDGMCQELQRDLLEIETENLDRLSPMLETSGLESKLSRTPSNSMLLTRRSSFLRKDKVEKTAACSADDGSTSGVKATVRKKSVEFDASEELSKSLSRETHSQYLHSGHENQSYSPPSPERRHCPSPRENSCPHAKTCASCKCQNRSLSPGREKEVTFLNDAKSGENRSGPPGTVCKQGREVYMWSENLSERDQETTNMACKDQNLENGAGQWKTRHCSRCRAQGKSCCDCSTDSRSHISFSNKLTSICEPDLSKQDMRYSCHSGLISASSKLSFNEIDSILECNSSLSKSQSRRLHSVERDRLQVCNTPDEINSSAFHHSDPKVHFISPKSEIHYNQNVIASSKSQSRRLHSVERDRLQMCNTPDEINSSAFHHSDPKVHFVSPKSEIHYDQNVIASKPQKVSCQGLPEKISTYLAKHLPAKREVYNNNNNRSFDLQLNSDLNYCLDITKKGSEISRHDQDRSPQKENLNKTFDYASDDSTGEGHRYSDANIEVVQEVATSKDFISKKERETRKQTLTRIKRESSHNDGTSNNSREGSNLCSHSGLFELEHNDEIRAKEEPLFGSVACSSKPKEKENTTVWSLEKVSKVDHVEHISAKSSIGDINPVSDYSHPEASNAETKVERNCEPTLLCLEREKAARFSEVTSMPTSSVSLSSRVPSLYKHLSQVHFSEKTRRYEWTTQPVLIFHSREKTASLRDESCEYSPSGPDMSSTRFCELLHTAREKTHENIIPDLIETRSENQFSDSGHFSISGQSSSHMDHNEKLGDQKYQGSENDISDMRRGRTGNCKKMYLEMANDHLINKAKRCSKQTQDQHNKNNNNNYYSDVSCLNNCPCSPNEVHTLLAIFQVPSHNFDPIARKLDFSDSVLEDSKVETEIYDSIQYCPPVCDNDEESIPVKDRSRISPSTSQGVVPAARADIDVLKSKVNERCEGRTRCYTNDQDLIDLSGFFDTRQVIISGNPLYVNSEHTTTSDDTRCASQGHSNSLRDNTPGNTNASQRYTNTWHEITNNNSKYFNTELAESESHSENPIKLSRDFQESPAFLRNVSDEEEMDDVFSENSEKNIKTLQRSIEEDIETMDSASEGELHNESNVSKLDADHTERIIDDDSTFSYMQHEHKDTYGDDLQSCNKYNPEHGPASGSSPEMNTTDPGTFFIVPESQHKVLDYDTSPPCIPQHYITFQNQKENCLEDTKDSNSSTACKTKVACPVPAWAYKNSLGEIADTFTDTLSAFLDDCQQDNESFMGTSVSPMSRLYKLLVKSQEMVHSLQKPVVISEADDTQICGTRDFTDCHL